MFVNSQYVGVVIHVEFNQLVPHCVATYNNNNYYYFSSENLSQKGRELQNSINHIVNSCKPTMEMMTQKVSNGYALALDWAIVMTEDAKKNLAVSS